METTQKKSSFKGIKSAGWVIVCCFILAICIYEFLLGNPGNFVNNDPQQSSIAWKLLRNNLQRWYYRTGYSNFITDSACS